MGFFDYRTTRGGVNLARAVLRIFHDPIISWFLYVATISWWKQIWVHVTLWSRKGALEIKFRTKCVNFAFCLKHNFLGQIAFCVEFYKE